MGHPVYGRYYYYNRSSLSALEAINAAQTVDLGAYAQRVFSQYVVWSPIDTEWAQYYTMQKEVSAADNYMTTGYEWGLMRYFKVSMPDSTTGTFSGTAAGFTTQVGATATITFTGAALDFFSYSDTTGGKWGVVVDGVAQPNYSVWAAVAAYKKGRLWTGTYGQHTCVLTFLGADTGTTGGTPFGWIGRDNTTTTNQARFAKAFWIIGSQSPNLCYNFIIGGNEINENFPVSGTNSGHKEYSFSVKAASGTTAVSNQWIPNHSSSTTASVFANVATDRTLKINGTGSDLFATLTDDVTFATGGTSVVLSQVYKGVNDDDTALNLFDITDVTTWTSEGMEYNVQATTLVNLAASTLYTSMLGVDNITHVLVDGGIEIDTSVAVTDQVIYNNSTVDDWGGNAIGVNKTGTDFNKSIVIAMQMITPTTSLKVATNPEYGQRVIWNISGVLKKLYPTFAVGYALPSGVTLSWRTKYSIGIVSDAYNTLLSRMA
jgi:hypothetical protein